MSFSEWMGESYNPGERGSISAHRSSQVDAEYPGWVVCLTFLLSIAMMLAAWWGVYVCCNGFGIKEALITLAISAAYFLVAYFVHPEPDTRNMGWCGGMLDNPFRWSDDVNRFLFFLKVMLLPGQFVARSIVGFIKWMRSAS